MRRAAVFALIGTMTAACGVDDRDRGADPIPGQADGGGASGGGGTGAAGGGNTGGTDGTMCGGGVVRAKAIVPDMLIVLDRSGSMKQKDVNRWDPSVSAVESMTAQLDDKIRFGLLMFPAVGANSCVAGTINVPVKLGAADEITGRLDGTEPAGGTPTGPSLEAALKTLNPGAAGSGQTATPKYVLLVTDGQPTCPKGDGENVTPEDIAQSNRAIDALLAKGVRTYVIGYDTKSDAKLASVLDGFAVHGGTATHRAVEDEASLLSEFQKITATLVSCTYDLEKAPPDPSFVLVKVDGKQLNLNQPDGWSIKGATITVEGQACKAMQDGKPHVLSVEVKCDLVPII